MSVTELQAQGKKAPTGVRFLTWGLSMPRETLYHRINQRTEDMIKAGLIDEAAMLHYKYQAMLAKEKLPALQSVGYQELFQYLDGKIEFATAVRLIQQHTRNYAKRQLTFFKNRLNVTWVDAPETDSERIALSDRLAHTP